MKIYIVPEIVSSEINNDNMYSASSTISSAIVGGTVGAIVADMVPGPAIPG